MFLPYAQVDCSNRDISDVSLQAFAYQTRERQVSAGWIKLLRAKQNPRAAGRVEQCFILMQRYEGVGQLVVWYRQAVPWLIAWSLAGAPHQAGPNPAPSAGGTGDPPGNQPSAGRIHLRRSAVPLLQWTPPGVLCSPPPLPPPSPRPNSRQSS